MLTGKDLEVVRNMLREVDKRVSRGTLETGHVIPALQAIIDGNFPKDDEISQYRILLSSLAEQKKLLIKHCGLSDEQFIDVDMTEPEQSADRLTILFYTTGNVRGDFFTYLYLLEHRGIRVWQGFDVGDADLRLSEQCNLYVRGVHRVVVDLTAGWQLKNGHSAARVLRGASSTLTGMEAFAAYALQDPALIKFLDGDKLPYCDTGILVDSDIGLPAAVYFGWNKDDEEVELT